MSPPPSSSRCVFSFFSLKQWRSPMFNTAHHTRISPFPPCVVLFFPISETRTPSPPPNMVLLFRTLYFLVFFPMVSLHLFPIDPFSGRFPRSLITMYPALRLLPFLRQTRALHFHSFPPSCIARFPLLPSAIPPSFLSFPILETPFFLPFPSRFKVSLSFLLFFFLFFCTSRSRFQYSQIPSLDPFSTTGLVFSSQPFPLVPLCCSRPSLFIL